MSDESDEPENADNLSGFRLAAMCVAGIAFGPLAGLCAAILPDLLTAGKTEEQDDPRYFS